MEKIKKVRIKRISKAQNEDVYDINVMDNHNFFANGILVHNCGEIPLSPYDACRLMAMNLYSYVENPFTDEAYFNYELFSKHARLTMKIMDSMIDLEIEKIHKILAKIESDPEDEETKKIEYDLWRNIREMNLKGRRSGIGITGEGDMLAALGLRYGTKEATKFATLVQTVLALSVYCSSCDMVQNDCKSKFPVFDFELEKNNPFLNRLANEDPNLTSDLRDEWHGIICMISDLKKEFREKWSRGRRNIACLTIAPTGSLSCLTQTTSGIEPVFQLFYTRRRKIDKSSGIVPDFIDKSGDYFVQFNVVHHKFVEWYSIKNGITFEEAGDVLGKMTSDELNLLIEKSPYYMATAMDCDWHERIVMQGSIQKYVDHSISMTCNLPKGTPESVVEDVYKTAWKSGCKGCTIYVDGSRDGVLLTNESKKCDCQKFIEQSAPKRPKKLPCKIIRFTNKGDKWIAAVGLYENKPYELFTGLADKLDIPKSAVNTYIVRNKIDGHSRYDIGYDDNGEPKIIEGLSTIFNEEFWNYGKLISGLLRHSMPVAYVIKVISSMNFKDDSINSWKSGVIRALKEFAKPIETTEKCPECGEPLWMEGGCCICKNCGYSKCQ